jgi:thioredoxin-like negative regulator of GroEL
MNPISKKVYIELNSRRDLHIMLHHNPGTIVIKLGATWCKPCQKIKSLVNHLFLQTADDVLCFDLDVDEMFDVYAYLKKNKMVRSIPAILVWKKGNTSVAPNYSINSSDMNEIKYLFQNNITV